VAQCPFGSSKFVGVDVDQGNNGEWWNGGWQRRGKSEWGGEKPSSFRPDDRGRVTLNEPAKGYWVESVGVCEKEKSKEYIAVIAGQYDESSNKMMFAAQAVRYMEKNISTGDNKYTFLVVLNGYSTSQLQLIKNSASKQNARVLFVRSFSDIANYINRRPDNGAIVEKLMIFSHGVPFSIELGYKLGSGGQHVDSLSINMDTFKRIDARAFSETATIESYACRTGMGNPSDFTVADVLDFPSEVVKFFGPSGQLSSFTLEMLKEKYGIHKVEDGIQLRPMTENSLAQHMANHYGKPVSAFVKRSNYDGTWGSDMDRAIYKVCKATSDNIDPQWCGEFKAKDKEREDNKDLGAVYNHDGASNDVDSGILSTPFIFGDSQQVFYPK
jgi:hypothetical protein